MCKQMLEHYSPTIKIYPHKKICSVNAVLTQRIKRYLVMPAVYSMQTLRNRQQAPFMVLGSVISSGKTKSLTNFYKNYVLLHTTVSCGTILCSGLEPIYRIKHSISNQ